MNSTRGLHAVAIVEVVKGALALLAASGLAVGGPEPVRRFIHALVERFNLDPREGVAAWLDHLASPTGIHVALLVASAYGVLHLVEAWGLWRERSWASWLGLIGAAAYLPFDLYALVRHPTHWLAWGVVIINLVVVYVLGRDLQKRRAIA